MDRELLTLTSVACTVSAEAIALIDNPASWDGVHNTGKVVAYNKRANPIDAYKVEAFIEKSPKLVIDYIYENWNELHLEMGNLIMTSNTIRRYNDNARLIAELTNFYEQEEPREILNFITRLELTDNTWAMALTNAENYADVPQSKYARGNLKFGIHLARPIFNNKSWTHFVALQHYDPKMEIPQEITESINTTRYAFYQRLVTRIQTDLF